MISATLWLLVALQVPGVSVAVSDLPGTLGFATADVRSNYYELGMALQQRLVPRGIPLRVIPTQGSYENVDRLRATGSRRADVALLQSDVAYLEHFQGRPYRAIASLNPEVVHVIARRDLGIHWVSDLPRLDREVLDVAVGEPNSGSAAHALALLDELGLRRCDSEDEEGEGPCARIHGIALAAAMRRLVDRRVPAPVLDKWGISAVEAGEREDLGPIDVAFVTSTAPVEELSDLVAAGRGDAFTLLGVDWSVARRMRRHNPFFIVTDLPYLKYRVDQKNRRVLGTPTLLVVSNDVSEAAVRALLEATYDLATSPAGESLSLLTGLTPSRGLEDVPIPVHPAALAFYAESQVPWARWVHVAGPYLVLIGVVLLPLMVFNLFAGTAYGLQRRRLGRIFVLLVYVWLVGSSFLFVFEGDRQSSFSPWGQSAVAVLHYLLSGLESKYPSTIGGIAVSILVLTVGVTVVALFTGEIARLFMERTLNVKRLRSKPFGFAVQTIGRLGPLGRLVSFLTLRDHVVVVGWSKRTERILQQLQSDDLISRPQAVVVTPEARSAETDDTAVSHGTWVVEGDPGSRSALVRADVPTAKAVLLLADGVGRGGLEEVRSVSCALTVKALLDGWSRGTRLIAEARSPAIREHLRDCNLPGEIIDTRALGERLLCQSVLTPGVVSVYDELLTFGIGSQELYVLPVPERLEGRSLRAICRALAASDALLLGARIDGDLVWLPSGSERAPSRESDRILVLADSARSLREGLLARLARLARWRTPTMSSGGEIEMSRSRDEHIQDTREDRSCQKVRLGVCGWDGASRRFIEELKRSQLAENREISIVVVADIDESRLVAVRDENGMRRMEPRDTEHLPDGVRFVIGDPTRKEVLLEAGVAEFDSLVILRRWDANGADEDGSTSDHRALVVCLAARSINPRIHLVTEMARPENREHFDCLDCVDLVCVDDLTEKLLAQAVISEGISEIYSELLHARPGSNEIYVVPPPSQWVGRTFEEIYLRLVDDAGHEVVPIGYQVKPADGRPPVRVLNPPRKRQEEQGVERWRQHPLGAEDALIVIAEKEPDW